MADAVFRDALVGLEIARDRLSALGAGSRFVGVVESSYGVSVAATMTRLAELVSALLDGSDTRFAADSGRAGANALPVGRAEMVGMTAHAAASAVDHLIAWLPATTQVDAVAMMSAAASLRYCAQLFKSGFARSPAYDDLSGFSARSATSFGAAYAVAGDGVVQDAGAAHACRSLIRSDPVLYPLKVSVVAQHCDAIVTGTAA